MKFVDHRVGDVLKLMRRRVTIEPDALYTEIGIRSFGRGIFQKPPAAGAALGDKRVFEIRPGDLVLNNVFAWEGAVALAGDAEAGTCGSHRFLTYVAKDAEAVDLAYLRCLFISDVGCELLGRASPGSAGRNRTLNIDSFEDLVVPLPSLPKQLRIVAKLDALLARVEAARQLDARAAETPELLYPALVDIALQEDGARPQPLGDLAEMISDVVEPGDDPSPARTFVGLQHIESHTGRKLGELPIGAERGPKLRFVPGDVLYPRLRPYQNKAWLADVHGLCSVDEYVLRPKPGVRGDLLAHALRSRSFLASVVDRISNLQLPRIRSSTLLQLHVRWPDAATNGLVVRRLDDERGRVLRLLDAQRARRARLDALRPAILSQAFTGAL